MCFLPPNKTAALEDYQYPEPPHIFLLNLQVNQQNHSIYLSIVLSFLFRPRSCEMSCTSFPLVKTALRKARTLSGASLTASRYFFFSLIVCLGISDVVICDIHISCTGTVNSVISCHSFFFLSLGFADRVALERHFCGSVITHYDTFIHTGCKVPWALPRGSPRVMRSLRRPLPNTGKLSAYLSNVRHGRLLFCETAPSANRKKTDFFLSFGYVTKVLYRSDFRSYAVYVRTKNQSRHSSGTYVHGETS